MYKKVCCQNKQGVSVTDMKHIILIMSLIIVLLVIYIIEIEKDCASVQPFFIKKEIKAI